MDEILAQSEIQLTKKEKILKFYNKNKIPIFVSVSFVFAIVIAIIFYSEAQEKKKKIIAQNYVSAKIYLEKNDKIKAKNILKKIVYSDSSIYSTLSFYLLLNENLIDTNSEKSELFTYIIKNNNFDSEIKDLIVFKKSLFESNFINESDLLTSLNPLINEDSLWKPHALLLLGDYFYSKNEFNKAREFYSKILLLKNINDDFYKQSKSQLTLMAND